MATFTPRKTIPNRTNKYFIHYNNGGYNTCIVIDKQTGWVMPNCVGYAQGRLLEILGKKAVNWKLPACNAEDWYATAEKNGLKVGSTPKLGAVICWRAGKVKNGSDGAGHVAVVEEIKANGDIVVSQSAYGSTEFYLSTISKAKGYTYSDSRPLVGFIYCGIEFEEEGTTYTVKKGDTLSAIARQYGMNYMDLARYNNMANPNILNIGQVIKIPAKYSKPVVTKPAEVKPAETKVVAGAKVTLNNTPCYTSETTKTSYGTKSGTFYYWDNVVKNGRIRITNRADRVGVKGQVTCWIVVKDIE